MWLRGHQSDILLQTGSENGHRSLVGPSYWGIPVLWVMWFWGWQLWGQLLVVACSQGSSKDGVNKSLELAAGDFTVCNKEPRLVPQVCAEAVLRSLLRTGAASPQLPSSVASTIFIWGVGLPTFLCFPALSLSISFFHNSDETWDSH